MPAKISLSSLFSKALRTRKPIYVLSAAAIIGLAVWAKGALVTTASVAPSQSAITPALTLAAGTLKLEGTEQAIDAASAAKLLPLWQLLAQLEGSSATASQEISTVIDEIQSNMTASQLEAIDAMSLTAGQPGDAASSSSSAKASGTQAASAVAGPLPGVGMFAGGGPMDGGGPMPGAGPRNTSTSQASASSTSSASPTLIEQVIQLLAKKVQG